MRMPRMAEREAGHEFVRLGNLVAGFEITAAIDEGEGLTRPIGAFGDERHILRAPGMSRLAAQAPTGRHAVLEDLDGDNAMSGVEAPHFLAMGMAGMVIITIVIMTVMMIARGILGALLILPRAPRHPERDGDDEPGRQELEIGLEAFGVHALPEIHSAERDAPHHDRVGESGGEA